MKTKLLSEICAMRILFGIFLCAFILLTRFEFVHADKNFVYLITDGKHLVSTHPYSKRMVSIRSRYPRKYFGDNHFCAGVIISEDCVLTCAHCVMDKRKVLTRPRRLLVVAGTPNRIERSSTTVEYEVASVIPHLEFMLNNTKDIGIIRIKGRFDFDNKNIDHMDLPTIPPPYGTNCTLLGWGRVFYRGPMAAAVMRSSVQLLHPEDCLEQLQRSIPNTICGSVGNSSNPCRGDDGGPLICNEVLTGLVAYTLGCSEKVYPTLYVNIYENLDWIKRTLSGSERMQLHFLINSLFGLFLIYFHHAFFHFQSMCL